VEFILAFVPVFIFIMCVIQLMLMLAGSLVVRHAANRAARSAIVVLPDDPARYNNEPVNRIVATGGGTDPMVAFFQGAGLGAPQNGAAGRSARLTAIRAAASTPLLAISPALSRVMARERNIFQALGGDGEDRYLGAVQYNQRAMAVNFPLAPGSDIFRANFDGLDNGELTARVTYLFHCAVPLAAALMCHALSDLAAGGDYAAGQREMNEADLSWNRLDGSSARFVFFRAEATLPYQGAAYRY
jgi:hypothetical protein